MTEANVLDTTIHEPPMTADEVDMLLFAVNRSRAQFAWKCGGLDAAGLRKPHPPSTMTLGGLLKHLALVEDKYTAVALTEQPIGPPWDWGEVHVGARQVFEDAGFEEVSRPTVRRVVMRINFERGSDIR